ncbi:uncharacterized protein LOC119724888 isoform X2 [Patiria miniata]|uniref:Uncharacterized protein n=1 Tax=Patiria miniata TaxID=46514 RepID=A0A913ZLA7_PATMI|nr:uncharacterized protein LOC119724888 isoform X2 [Patiria miniata]
MDAGKMDRVTPDEFNSGKLQVKALVAALNTDEKEKPQEDSVDRIPDSNLQLGHQKGCCKIASLVLTGCDQHVNHDPENQQKERSLDLVESPDRQLQGNNSNTNTVEVINQETFYAKSKQTIQEAGTNIFKGDFLSTNASSELKIESSAHLCLAQQNLPPDLFDGVLDINTVASLLPKDRTSTEESAIEHILALESDQSRHRHHSVPNEDCNGFTSEQDSGIFDLSLVQQDDFETFDNREASREWPVRNITPEQRRKHLQRSVSDSSKLLGHRPKEGCHCQKVKRNLRIPSCFINNPPLFLGSEVCENTSGQNIKLPVNPPATNTETKQAVENIAESCSQVITDSERGETRSTNFLESGTQNLTPPNASECQERCSLVTSSDSEPESNKSLEDYLEDITMGKKTQSLSKGRQPHVVYSKEEFSEEYASPKRSKSWDKKKHGKKGSEKKDKQKPKDRKRVLSDPSQGMDLKVVISPPLTVSQEESLRNKRHTIGGFLMTMPTQEAGTDTSELLADSEMLTAHQESRQFAATPNVSNNNQEQHKSKKRLAQSRAGGISPEVIPTASRHPLRKQQGLSSPEVIADTLSKASSSSDVISDGPPPPKPKRLSLTNQLQKQNDKSLDVSIHQDGSQLPYPKKDNVYERKTEIAVERQVLLKQATKSNPLDQQSQLHDSAVSSHKQANRSDAPGPFSVVTRYGDDGEEELILGALPLQEKQQEVPPESKPSVPNVARKPEKPIPAKRKIRHYACIEPVGKPVQAIKTEEHKEESTPKKSPTEPPKEEQSKPNLDQIPSSDEAAPVSKSSTIDQEVKPPVQQTPPVVITGPPPDTSLKVRDVTPDSPSTSLPPKSPSSPETQEDPPQSQTNENTPLSVDINRSRLTSSSDTASTASIPPQSPPDLDYQELLAQATPSEHSLPSSSEPSINIDFAKLDPAMEQKMVTVSVGMMPEVQKAEVTVINEDCQEVNSTDEVERQEAAEVQQQPMSPDTKESATESPPTSEVVTSQPDIPSISSKEEDEVDNEEDEDSGVYDASYRHSDWIYVGNNQELQMMTKQVEMQAGAAKSLQTVAEVNNSQAADEVPQFDRADEARESVTTTSSENEFRMQHQSLAYRRVHRKTSAIDYQRLSLIARERKVTIKKVNNMFGFRIQYSRPVVVTDVDKGGAAEQAGLRVGDMVLRVNGHDVRQAPHSQVVRLAMSGPDPLDLVVGTNVCNTLNLYAEKPVMCGYLHKLGGAGMIRTWKKRWFVLKYDNCLYYYKTEDDVEPLGAIVLCNYTVMKARDVGKSYAFKLTKCKARTYYFYTATEEEMSRWAKNITEAAKPQNTSDIWLDISTHNVGLPALSIRNPDCHGFLNKLGAIRKTWKKRFCVLKDACLYYYKDIDAQHALGVAHFHGYSIQETEIGSKKYGLVLKHPSQELRVFYFLADHETDRKRWVAAFAMSIGRWIQTNNGEESDEESAEMLI